MEVKKEITEFCGNRGYIRSVTKMDKNFKCEEEVCKVSLVYR